MTRVYLLLLTFTSIIYPIICSRKYDIDLEAQKLYGEDLKSVLKRFRRTPEYLKILDDKMSELIVYFNDMGNQVLDLFVNQKLPERIAEMWGVSEKEERTTPSYYQRFFYRRQLQNVPNTTTATISPIQRLDWYHHMDSDLTITEKHAMADLGFEFAGNVIHTMIKIMGPEEESPAKSTKGALGGDQTYQTTTEHVSVHEVTPESTQTSPEHEHTPEVPPENTSPADNLRNKGRNRGKG